MISPAQAADRKQLLDRITDILKNWPQETKGVFAWSTFADILNEQNIRPPYSPDWTPYNINQYCGRNRIVPKSLLPVQADVASDARGGYSFGDTGKVNAKAAKEELVNQVKRAVQEVVDFYVSLGLHPADHEDGEKGCNARFKEAVAKHAPDKVWTADELHNFIFDHKIGYPIAHIQRKVGYPKPKAVRRL